MGVDTLASIPDYRGNELSFSSFSMMLAIGYVYSLYDIEVHSF